MSAHRRKLTALLRRIESAPRLDEADWSEVVGTARNANLLGKLAAQLEAARLLPEGPARRHLDGALKLSRRQRQSVHWEVQCLDDALARLGIPVVLLKGAAYVLGGLAAGEGRLFGDIDLLVPRDSLGAVELRMMVAGWTAAKADAYDQRYYRQWMHELPPMVHVRRGTVVDVHHTILPLTARHRPDAARIIERSAPLAGSACMRIPCAEDLVIHSLCHLVHEGEVHNALRDMHDIDALLREHGQQQDFWARLTRYAIEHQLGTPTALGLRLVHHFLGTTLPEDELARMSPRDDARLVRLYDRAIAPHPVGAAPRSAHAAQALIYLRAHWLRMPPVMLARHLARKGWRRAVERQSPNPQMQ